ncbi:NAD(P)-binding protein [Coniochaeta sp. PMI_546]|nr:NAD(P)-binding protein [Coniochaeta sp. PMI_546]
MPLPLFDPVLVTGGCGFLGYTLVRQLLDDSESGEVYVLDREISRNQHVDAHYVEGDICDRPAMERLLNQINPRVIFHLASPNFTFPKRGRVDFYQTNVRGTEILLELSANCISVKAFVNCSSIDIYADAPHTDVDETHPTCTSPSHEAYAHTKALSDSLVLAANGPRLRTTSLRLAHMYGPRCSQQLQVLLDMCAGNGPLFQLGPGTNMIEVVSVDNAAAAHILAAKALVDPGRAHGKVDGEAFNISDGKPVPFWYHTTLFWSAARRHPVAEELIIIPAWLARFIFGFVQWVFWIFTLGYVDPPANMSTTALSYSLESRTYSSKKAKERLGFKPLLDHDAIISRSVAEELGRREKEKSAKLKGKQLD